LTWSRTGHGLRRPVGEGRADVGVGVYTWWVRTYVYVPIMCTFPWIIDIHRFGPSDGWSRPWSCGSERGHEDQELNKLLAKICQRTGKVRKIVVRVPAGIKPAWTFAPLVRYGVGSLLTVDAYHGGCVSSHLQSGQCTQASFNTMR
jgi:hypothetical protein